MQKWVNIVIRVTGRIVDIYVNGTLTKRKSFDRVIKQNYGNIKNILIKKFLTNLEK